MRFKKLKNNYRVAITNMTWQREPAFQCWRNYEYFMLKQCLENIGEGLLHACISSYSIHVQEVVLCKKIKQR